MRGYQDAVEDGNETVASLVLESFRRRFPEAAAQFSRDESGRYDHLRQIAGLGQRLLNNPRLVPATPPSLAPATTSTSQTHLTKRPRSPRQINKNDDTGSPERKKTKQDDNDDKVDGSIRARRKSIKFFKSSKLGQELPGRKYKARYPWGKCWLFVCDVKDCRHTEHCKNNFADHMRKKHHRCDREKRKGFTLYRLSPAKKRWYALHHDESDIKYEGEMRWDDDTAAISGRKGNWIPKELRQTDDDDSDTMPDAIADTEPVNGRDEDGHDKDETEGEPVTDTTGVIPAGNASGPAATTNNTNAEATGANGQREEEGSSSGIK